MSSSLLRGFLRGIQLGGTCFELDCSLLIDIVCEEDGISSPDIDEGGNVLGELLCGDNKSDTRRGVERRESSVSSSSSD